MKLEEYVMYVSDKYICLFHLLCNLLKPEVSMQSWILVKIVI